MSWDWSQSQRMNGGLVKSMDQDAVNQLIHPTVSRITNHRCLVRGMSWVPSSTPSRLHLHPPPVALRVQRMPSGQEEFGNPADYPYMCVASPSSHDTTTTRAWYEEDGPRRQRYFAQVCAGPSRRRASAVEVGSEGGVGV